jgi:hypothetical protein
MTPAGRLLTDDQAAAYLGVRRSDLKGLPLRLRVPINGKPRWDRRAIDAWLDAQTGLVAPSPAQAAAEIPDDGDAALDGWLKDKGADARAA